MIQKLIFGVAIAAMMVSMALSADVLLNKKHKGLDGKDGAKVNCVYCHQTAGVTKKGKNYEEYKKGPYCSMEGCH